GVRPGPRRPPPRGRADRVRPALASQRARRARAFAADDHLDVVEGRIRSPSGIDPWWIVGRMRRRVPAPLREVDAAAVGDRIVDDDDLLVVRTPGRMVVVEPEPQPAMRAPVEARRGQELPLERIDHGEVPLEQIDPQLGTLAHQRIQEWPQAFGHPVVRWLLPAKPRAAVEVPAQHADGMARGEHGRADRAKVVGDIDDHRRAPGVLDSPDIASGLEQRRAGIGFGRAHERWQASDMPVACPMRRSDLRSLLFPPAWIAFPMSAANGRQQGGDEIPAPFVGATAVVLPEWIDYNGHMNV